MEGDESRGGAGPADGRSAPVPSGDPSAIKLGSGVEFDLIRAFLPRSYEHQVPGVRLGVGDDAAIVEGDGIVLTSDLSIEGVHFLRSWLEPRAIGYRAAAASLSDLAAMAARPIGVLASVAVASGDATTFAVELMRGVTDAVTAVGGVVLGGDLTRSPGPLILDITSVGTTATPVLRSGASPGDELWVTGTLGAAALAVSALLATTTPPAGAFQRFATPQPRIAEALWLAERGLPMAMLDLSDGLGKDAGHLAAASGLAVHIDPSVVPVHPDIRADSSIEESAGQRIALSGGEDYELCFAGRPGAVEPHRREFKRRFGLALSKVGRFELGEGVFVGVDAGHPNPFQPEGFQHFGGPP